MMMLMSCYNVHAHIIRIYVQTHRLTSYRSAGKRESCVSSTTTTTVLLTTATSVPGSSGGSTTSSYAVHHRDLNAIGGSTGGGGGGVQHGVGGASLPMSALPKAISPLAKVGTSRSACVRVCVYVNTMGRVWASAAITCVRPTITHSPLAGRKFNLPPTLLAIRTIPLFSFGSMRTRRRMLCNY